MSDQRSERGVEELELDWGDRAPRTIGSTPIEPSASPSEGNALRGRGAPGDPQHMSIELQLALEPLLKGAGLGVRQALQWPEIFVGWETRKRYEVTKQTGHPVVYVGEAGAGLASSLARNFWPFRMLRLEMMTLGGILALALNRPWSLFFARFEVEAWDGRPLGKMKQRFRIWGRAMDILSPGGSLLASIRSSPIHPWTFHVYQNGAEVATIRNKWTSLAQELMTDADNYEVDFLAPLVDGKLRQLVLAAALAIDLTWFENRDTRGKGLLRWSSGD